MTTTIITIIITTITAAGILAADITIIGQHTHTVGIDQLTHTVGIGQHPTLAGTDRHTTTTDHLITADGGVVTTAVITIIMAAMADLVGVGKL